MDNLGLFITLNPLGGSMLIIRKRYGIGW